MSFFNFKSKIVDGVFRIRNPVVQKVLTPMNSNAEPALMFNGPVINHNITDLPVNHSPATPIVRSYTLDKPRSAARIVDFRSLRAVIKPLVRGH